MAKPLPVHAPLRRAATETAYSRRVLGRREARRLAELMEDAERRARARIEAAKREAEEIFAQARAEANAILQLLPNLDELEATPAKKGRTALSVIRSVADRHGLPLAVVAGRQAHQRATAARAEAVAAVSEACPNLTLDEIGALFSGRGSGWAAEILRRKGAGRP
jgi:chromosomal replication initiation ATPase DnaA